MHFQSTFKDEIHKSFYQRGQTRIICCVPGGKKVRFPISGWCWSLTTGNNRIPLNAPTCSHFSAGSWDIAKFIKYVSELLSLSIPFKENHDLGLN